MQLLVCFTMALAVANPGPDTLVICPDAFQPAMRSWVEYRRDQGYRVEVQSPAGSSYSIRQQIRRAAQAGTLQHVVLVGDAVGSPVEANRLVPTDYVRARVNVRFGSEPEIATDNTYADVDGDGQPDLAIGRIPVDSAAELEAYIARVKQYELAANSGSWQRRINFVAGVGGFGQLVDKLIEQSTKQMITELIPAEYQTTMTYGSWTSPYCPHPYRFSDTAIERFNEGCLFWCYIGHGSRHRLDHVMLPDGRADILDCQTAPRLAVQAGSPIAIFLACYTSAIDDPQDCLAEEMLRQKRGPIAVIGSTRVAMPYAMSVLSLGMLREYFHGEARTLGDLVLVAKQRMVAAPDSDDEFRQMIDAMGNMFSPEPELLADELREHVQLMHVLGDPLLRLKRPDAIEFAAPERVVAGESISVQGQAPYAGALTVEVCYARDRFRIRPTRRKEYDPDPVALAEYDREYRNAHDLTCVRQSIDVQEGEFELNVPVPVDASGECHVRLMLQREDRFAMGSHAVTIERIRLSRKPN